MKRSYLLLVVCLGCFFSACTPDFNLNAPYKDVPVVYGILDYRDSIHYVKIYKGFQPEHGNAFIDAQNPDSIYYYDNIIVILEEYNKDVRTSRPAIPLTITHDFPRDSGIFCYDEERIIYHTKEPLYVENEYKIIITNIINGNVIESKTSLVGDFSITSGFNSFLKLSPSIAFSQAENAADYEIHVNFIYFEVDIRTNKVVKIGKVERNICPKPGGTFSKNYNNDLVKEFSPTFYDDIAAQLKADPNVVRYIGTPGSNGTGIEVVGWAAGESMTKFLISSQPSSSFVQVNNIYTNLTASQDLVFGFFSSRIKCPTRRFAIDTDSEKELISGPLTHHLGFRPWSEYKP